MTASDETRPADRPCPGDPDPGGLTGTEHLPEGLCDDGHAWERAGGFADWSVSDDQTELTSLEVCGRCGIVR